MRILTYINLRENIQISWNINDRASIRDFFLKKAHKAFDEGGTPDYFKNRPLYGKRMKKFKEYHNWYTKAVNKARKLVIKRYNQMRNISNFGDESIYICEV